MSEKNIKKQIEKYINQTKYLSDFDKFDWINRLDTLTDDELKETYKFFKRSNEVEEGIRFKLLFDAKLNKEYLTHIKKISNKFQKSAMKKQEKKDKQK